jgi:hypothetical protein
MHEVNEIESSLINNDMNIDQFSPLKTSQQTLGVLKTPKKENACLSDSQFMDVDDDDFNNLLNNFEDSQELKKFNSIFSNESG